MKTNIHTSLGIAAALHLITGIPFELKPNTTLNQKLGILADFIPPGGVFPQMKYFCIGNGAHVSLPVGSNVTSSYHMPVQHESDKVSLISMVPFIMREEGNDIPITERAKYALRRKEAHKGTNFICYYLKRLDWSKSHINQNVVRQIDGETNTSPKVYTASDLEPTQNVYPVPNKMIVDSDYVDVYVENTIVFTEADAKELINVSNILYDNEFALTVSEVGLVTGIDKDITVNDPGQSPFTFREVVCAQLAHAMTTNNQARTSDGGFDISFNLGTTETLFKLVDKN